MCLKENGSDLQDFIHKKEYIEIDNRHLIKRWKKNLLRNKQVLTIKTAGKSIEERPEVIN